MKQPTGQQKPSRLSKLKRWFTVPEAAEYLSVVFGEKVVEADVLRLGLDGYLKLSVRFVNFTYGVVHKERSPLSPEEIQAALAAVDAMFKRRAPVTHPDGSSMPAYEPAPRVLPSPVASPDPRVIKLGYQDEIYDLPMIGGERHDVENLYQQLTDGPDVTLIDLEGPFVDSEDGTRFSLRAQLEDKSWFPPGCLPEDSVFVVRNSALREFESRAIDQTTPAETEKPLTTRERGSLLVVIAALAGEAGIDLSKHSKAAVTIESLTTDLGARVAARTIEEHLKKVADALERRGQ